MAKLLVRQSLLTSTVLAGSLLIVTPAFAQAAAPQPADDATTGETIVVTGSLIQNPNITSSSPVTAVGSQEINLRQTDSAEEILREIPGVVPGLGGNVNNGQLGSANVDLRGLGPNRNIVLLDSTRLVPANTAGTVDLNNIPLALIERVDVLTGGAAVTYGADAVTGVVNFITKNNFAGVDFKVGESITEKGDANTLRSDLTIGANFDDGRGNAVLSLGYIETDPLYFGSRPLGVYVINSLTGLAAGDSPTATPTAIAFDLDPTQNYQISPTGGSLVPQYATFNFNPFNIFQTPFKRYNMYAAAHYDATDSVSVYTRGLFSKNVISSIVAPSGIFAEALTVPANNPFLTTALRNQICTMDGIALGPTCDTNPAIPVGAAVYRRTTEVGPRIDRFTTQVFDMKAGLTVKISDHLKLDAYGAYGESTNVQERLNYVARSRLQQALNATNTTTCTVTTGGCVPLNLFGVPGSITPDMAGFIGGVTSTISRDASLAQAHGVLTGDFGVSSPWASEPIAFAVGSEYRKYTATIKPDNLAQVPGELGGAGGAVLPLDGSYNALDFFGELVVPIVSDKPFFQDLSIEGGVRHSRYRIDAPGNPSFSATSYKIGGSWTPVDAIKLRANYQRAVRAPSIFELFTPVATGLTALATDPCAGAAPVGNANLTQACINQGAPATAIGSIQNPAAGQANATAGGNPFLKPEVGKTITAGVVLAPRAIIPGFTATIDYYRIKVANSITPPLPNDVIAACFGTNPAAITAAQAASPACTSIRRGTNGRLSGSTATVPGLPTPLTNAGALFTDGVDLSLDYRRDVGFAKLNLDFAGNYTHSSKFRAASNLPYRECVGYYSANCGIAIGQIQPRYSWTQRTTLDFDGVAPSLLWRHISSARYEPGLPPLYSGVITGSGPLVGQSYDFNRIKAFDYFDFSARFSVGDHLEITATAFNVLDKKPPVVGNQAGSTFADSGNTFPSTYDTLGRRYGVTARVTF